LQPVGLLWSPVVQMALAPVPSLSAREPVPVPSLSEREPELGPERVQAPQQYRLNGTAPRKPLPLLPWPDLRLCWPAIRRGMPWLSFEPPQPVPPLAWSFSWRKTSKTVRAPEQRS